MKEARERLIKIAQDPAQYKPLLEGLITQVFSQLSANHQHSLNN
jgi:hypothetical protein